MLWRSWVRVALVILWVAVRLPAAEVDADDLQRLAGRLTASEESIEAFRALLQRLEGEVRTLRAENEALRQAVANRRDAVTTEQLKRVVDQVQEVDRNRIKDNQQVLEALRKLEKVPLPPPPSRTERQERVERPERPARPEAADPGEARPPAPKPPLPADGYVHRIKEGESLGVILEAYRKEHQIKTSMKQVLEANPSIKDPRRVRVGQEVFIPAVK